MSAAGKKEQSHQLEETESTEKLPRRKQLSDRILLEEIHSMLSIILGETEDE